MTTVTRDEVRTEGFTDPPYSDDRVDAALEAIDEYIEEALGTWFDVRDLSLALDGSGANVQPIPHPIISIDSVEIFGNPVYLSDLKIYNRHLQGYRDTDDTQDPRLEYIGGYFPEGRQNVVVTGKFGYRAYDPLNAQGKIPLPLKRAIFMMLPRFLESAASPYSMAAWRSHEVSKKTTRGQSCEMSSAITRGELYGGITGDVNIDRLLSMYTRPIGGGVV